MFFLPRVIMLTSSPLVGCLAHQPGSVKSGVPKIRPSEVSPEPSAPWHFEHFCLYRVSVDGVLSAADETVSALAGPGVKELTARKIPAATRSNLSRSFMFGSETFRMNERQKRRRRYSVRSPTVREG